VRPFYQGIKLALAAVLVAIAAALLYSPKAIAAPDYSALSVRQLLTQCLNDGASLYTAVPSCDLYISGFTAAIRQFNLNDKFCSEENGLEISAIRHEFVQWAIFHSEQYDTSAAEALAEVMDSLYSCANKP